jgi:integrase
MVTPSQLVATVHPAMAERGDFSVDSTERLTQLMTRFASFAEQGFGITEASSVTRRVVEGFVKARSASGSRPAVATMHIRRSAVRLLYSEGRRLGEVHHDPTLDIVLPARSSLRTRPLTDDEIALCRSYSVRTLTETRQPAAWALAEATARSAELAQVRVCDVDLAASRVWIAGSTKTEPRWGTLSGWGKVQIERRLRAMPAAIPSTPLVCGGAKRSVSATSSASIAIALTLRRAGLAKESDVRPGSVAAWAGALELGAGKTIDQVACLLGIRSLDRAAEFIGFDWRGQEPQAPPGRPS